MGKTIKRLLVAAALMFVIGIVLCGVCFAFGVRSSNFTFLGYDPGETTNIDNVYTESIRSLDIEMAAGTLNIVEGDEFRVVGENVPEDRFVAEVDNGVLKVKNDPFRFLNFISIGVFLDDDIESMKVTVYVPADFELEKLEVDVDAGKAYINDLTAKKTDIDLSAGSVSANNLVVTDKTEIEVGAGSLNLDGASLHDMEVKVSAGEANIEGTITGKNKLDCGAGSIKITTSLKENEYDYKADVSAGSIKLNGEKLKDGNKIDNDASNSFDIDCSAGSILIDTIF